jgi:hypothetical protein
MELGLIVDIRRQQALHISLLDYSLAQMLERDEVMEVQKMVKPGDLVRKMHFQ